MQFVSINGHLIHYRYMLRNKGERTFVFINSLGTDFRIWEEVVDEVKEQENILLFDNRGHGLSDVVEDTRGLNDFANDTFALLDHLSINRCVIVGLSVGGMVAQIMASRSPQRIDGLILCDTACTIGKTDFWNERIAVVKEKGMPAVSEAVMPRWFSEAFRSEQPQKVKGCRNMLERMPAAGYIKACEAIRDADLSAVAAGIKHPTLCIVGSEDASTTPAEVKALASLIEGSGYVVIEASGHLPCIDNPQALSKLIIEFAKLSF